MHECRLLIADADTAFTDSLCSFLSNNPCLNIIGVDHNGDSALKTIHQKHPDIILMNLLLPSVDGMSILRSVRNIKNPPFTICCTEFYSDTFIEAARMNGATYCIYKPVEYSSLLSAILECDSQREAALNRQHQNLKTELSNLHRIMHNLGFSTRHSGYSYLMESVQLAARSPLLLRNMQKGLYLEIASKLNSTPVRVERSIRTAIAFANSQGRLGRLMGCIPTNKECIRFMLQMLSSEP